LEKEESKRYERHLNLPNFSLDHQHKLKQSKVLVIGAGGLGAPLLQYLVAAGVGTIGIVDFDRVEESNLHRQILFDDGDIGKLKVKTAAEKLKRQNSHVNIIEYPLKLDSSNALEIISNFDIVADGSDNFPTRYLVNDACVIASKTNVFASIFRFEGQVSVFNYQGIFSNPNYRDLFPNPPLPGSVPNCAEAGVLGVLPGIIGAMQANEVIKIITGLGKPLLGKLFLFDALSMQSRTITIKLDKARKQINRLIDYDEFCGVKLDKNDTISADELKKWIEMEYPFFMVDVRDENEHETKSIGGLNIPLKKMEERIGEIPKEVEVVFYCQAGIRSLQAVKFMKQKRPNQKFLNLEGGCSNGD